MSDGRNDRGGQRMGDGSDGEEMEEVREGLATRLDTEA